MKYISLVVFLFLIISSTQAKTLIVSDVDDTIKVTNVLNTSMKIINGLFTRISFSGMSELYQQMNRPDTTLYYVSGSPNIIRPRVNSFLKFNNFPQSENLILKKGKVTTYDYKVSAIRNLISKINPDKIILLGDDTEFDPEVYNTIYRENEEKVEGIYIRVIKNRILPTNDLIKNFFSPVEVAGLELIKGNFKITGLNKVASAFIDQEHCSKLVIKHRYCPAEGRVQIEELKQRVSEESNIDSLERSQQKIVETCRK